MTGTIRTATPLDDGALAELATVTFPLACPPGSSPEDVAAHLRDTLSAGKFAQYLFRVHEEYRTADNDETAHQMIEEATLFVDASHQCYARLGSSLGAPAPAVLP